MTILFIAVTENFLAVGWVEALIKAGNKVYVLQIGTSNNNEKMIALGASDVIAANMREYGLRSILLSEVRSTKILNNEIADYINTIHPDLVLSWWALSVYPVVKYFHRMNKSARVIFCLSTYPNSSNRSFQMIENMIWENTTCFSAGYIFYSDEMKKCFLNKFRKARKLNNHVMIDPYPTFNYSLVCNSITPENLKLDRNDTNPYIVFTGRTDFLFTKNRKMAQSDVSEIVQHLLKNKIHVYIQGGNDRIESEYLHYIPRKLNLYSGELSQYLSQFDAHLVCYNEINELTKHRVRNGLGTRFAFGLSFPVPIIVSENTKFCSELFEKYSIGCYYSSMDDLVKKLYNIKDLNLKKENFKNHFMDIRRDVFDLISLQKYLESVVM